MPRDSSRPSRSPNNETIVPYNAGRQGKWWMLTIPMESWFPKLETGTDYIKGQLEQGESTGYLHWQVLVHTKEKTSTAGIKRLFGIDGMHCELTYSRASSEYVWKEATRQPGTQFELGIKPIRRNVATDWDAVYESAKRGQFDDIPAQIRICHCRNLEFIYSKYMQPVFEPRKVVVYWGPTGTGKSRRAWDEAGISAYPKDPMSKFWQGYRDQKHVVIDEFRGDIAISHTLRWFDRYGLVLEIKGSSTPAQFTHVWITSNLHPREWYPNVDKTTYEALERRLTIERMPPLLFEIFQ